MCLTWHVATHKCRELPEALRGSWLQELPQWRGPLFGNKGTNMGHQCVPFVTHSITFGALLDSVLGSLARGLRCRVISQRSIEETVDNPLDRYIMGLGLTDIFYGTESRPSAAMVRCCSTMRGMAQAYSAPCLWPICECVYSASFSVSSTTHANIQTNGQPMVSEREVHPDALTRILLQNSLASSTASSKADAIGRKSCIMVMHPLSIITDGKPFLDAIDCSEWVAPPVTLAKQVSVKSLQDLLILTRSQSAMKTRRPQFACPSS